MDVSGEFKNSNQSERSLSSIRLIGVVFFFLCFTLPLILIGISILYSERVFFNISIPSVFHRYSFSVIYIISAFLGFILVNNKIFKLATDRQIDAIVFLISLFVACFWAAESIYNGILSSFIFSNISFSIMVLISGIFLVLLSLMLIRRPKFRFGTFIQVFGLSLMATSTSQLIQRITPADHFIFILLIFIVCMIFGMSLAYRIKIEREQKY